MNDAFRQRGAREVDNDCDDHDEYAVDDDADNVNDVAILEEFQFMEEETDQELNDSEFEASCAESENDY